MSQKMKNCWHDRALMNCGLQVSPVAMQYNPGYFYIVSC
jgi:hypothetical protein